MNDELPPLPNALHGFYGQPMYSSGQMSDYVEAARAPLLARIAELEADWLKVSKQCEEHFNYSTKADERAEKAEAEVERLRGLLLDIRSHVHPDLRKRIDAALKEKL
jgi:hypothetical protein